MLVVHFPEELYARAPKAIGRLCLAPSNEWVSLITVAEAVDRGETVTIRPASENELRRADAFVSLYEIGLAMGEKIGILLDKESPDDVKAHITAVREAVESVDLPLPGLLDPVGE